MAATVTYAKALKIVDQLANRDRERLFRKMREQRRKVWLAKIEAETEQALKDHRAGQAPFVVIGKGNPRLLRENLQLAR